MMPAPDGEHPWRFEVCKRCLRRNVAGFRVTDSMWGRVTGATPYAAAVLCINDFDELAAERGIDWTEEPVEFYCLSSMAAAKFGDVEQIIDPGAQMRNLFAGAVETDGEHHKIWYIEQIAERLDIALPEHEPGISP
jgi:hypothetical protein